MPNGEETPEQAAARELVALKEAAAPEVEGITGKLQGAFWDKVSGFFATMFGHVWDESQVGLVGAFEGALTMFLGHGVDIVGTGITDKISDILEANTDPVIILRELEHIAESYPIFDWVYKMLQIILTLAGMLTAGISASQELASQEVLRSRRPTLLPLEYAVDAVFKDPALKDVAVEILNRVGLSDTYQDILWSASESPLSALDARMAFLRGEIDESKHDTVLRAHHLSEDAIETVKTLYEIIPPVQDIITMAVREVFSPDIVEKFGQMEGLPEDFTEWAATQGLSTFWASAYWAAHWSLPSVGQGFEMLHRAVIDDDELDMLLRALDIMPFWRTRLTEISYNPLTRVDVRRMHKMGVLDEDRVMRSYLDIGYNEENARLMTEFTVAFNMQGEKELSKGDIIALFKKYAVTGESATEMLTMLGYSQGNAELLVTKATFEIYAAYKKKQLAYIGRAYVAGKITESVAVSKLGALDLPASETNYLLETWDLDRQSKVRTLTLQNLADFYKANVITETELSGELLELGYNVQDTSRFIALFKSGGAQ